MEVIWEFILGVLRPLSLEIVVAALVAGIIFGAIYNYRLNLPDTLVYHKAVAGWAFIAFVFLFRAGAALLGSTTIPAFAGWLGIGILWGIYCGSMLLGRKLAPKIIKLKKLLDD